jgi:hypothetical protein
MNRQITSQNPSSDQAVKARENLYRLFQNRPMSDEELLVNLGLFMRSGALAKLLFLDEMYRKIVNIPGIICEFGVWMGQSIVMFENLRAVYEPYNYTRRIVGFDTFAGYPKLGSKDVRSELIKEGVYKVDEGYESYLAELLDYHEQENVMSHIKKHALIKGDAAKTCKKFVDSHPEVLIALAYFDMALYEPTKKCLQAILPRLIKGSVIAFDELCHPEYPGETRAALEVLGTREHVIARSRYLPDRTFVIMS